MPELRPRVPDGVIVAASTPFTPEGQVDHARYGRHLAALAAEGCDGVLVAGTTGEGPSLSVVERRAMLEAALAALPSTPILAVTGCASLTDTIELTRHLFDAGGAAAIVGPPFFYKAVEPDGLRAYYAAVLEAAVPADGAVLLYNVPQETMVPIPLTLVEQLVTDAGPRIVGIKDSEGDLERLVRTVDLFPELRVYTGAEPLLQPFVAAGGRGAISGLANLIPGMMRDLVSAAKVHDHSASARQAEVTRLWQVLTEFRPYPPAIKAILAARSGDPDWLAMRPPLLPLSVGRMDELSVSFASSAPGAKPVRSPG